MVDVRIHREIHFHLCVPEMEMVMVVVVLFHQQIIFVQVQISFIFTILNIIFFVYSPWPIGTSQFDIKI
jgi:hypothetical protein